MDKILNLTLSYPDFQLNQVIDPDQVDLNNAQVVSKVNEISTKLNTLFTGTTGAQNITIEPIQNIDATEKNVQKVIETIVNKLVSVDGADFIKTTNNVSIQELLNMLDQSVITLQTDLQNAKSKISTSEQVIAFHGNRLTSVENTNSSQAEAINSANTKISDIEAVNETQDASISALQTKTLFQDTQIATLNSTTTSHNARIGTLETKATDASSQITGIKNDISRINATNTNQEVVDAKAGFNNLKARIDYNEISIGANPSASSKLNMIVTDSNAPEFWEDKVAVASLEEHNIDPTAHGGTITAHNVSLTAHEDIRQLISKKASTWVEITGKPTTFPPIYHTHDKSQINGFAHTHVKSEVTDFAHTHTKANITDFAHTHAKSEVGLGSVDNVKQMPIAGGTFAGNVTMASNAKLSGHIVIPFGKPTNAVKGSLWLE